MGQLLIRQRRACPEATTSLNVRRSQPASLVLVPNFLEAFEATIPFPMGGYRKSPHDVLREDHWAPASQASETTLQSAIVLHTSIYRCFSTPGAL